MLKSVYVVQDDSTMEILGAYATPEGANDAYSERDDVSIFWVPVF